MEHFNFVMDRLTDCPSMSLPVCLSVLYAAYYFLCVAKRPVIFCGDKDLRKFIEKHCPASRDKFWPTWWCIQPHAQTIIRSVLQSSVPVGYTEEYLETLDGGEIRLDWKEGSNLNHTQPTVLFMPGIIGCSKEPYILHLVHHVTSMGYRSVVFNNRGTGDTHLKTARTYCASDMGDIKLVIAHIKKRYPQAPLIGVGISFGGVVLFNYLASVGPQAEITAAMLISPCYDLHETRSSLNSWLNYWLFNRMLAKSLCAVLQKNLHLFENHIDIDTAHVLKSESIDDFNARLTCKLFGLESVDYYYTIASIHTKLHALARPVLCLSAADDPFAPDNSIPTKHADVNKNIAIIKTSRGGHIGFMEGTFPRTSHSYICRLFEQYVTAVVEHGLKAE